HAGELIAEAALAIEMGCEVEGIGHTIHPHPTLSESVAMAAEAYGGTITELYLPKKNWVLAAGPRPHPTPPPHAGEGPGRGPPAPALAPAPARGGRPGRAPAGDSPHQQAGKRPPRPA